ncbi:MAG: 2-isopropylmalate synthase [Gammaproteobacteria bacterium]|nr:2-isopropylmalate synthase [Gammaproteobacteria bacterium]
MAAFDHHKYRPFRPVGLTDRTWPDRVIERAPQWCSVDLRDGNQALIEPMNVAQKMQMFDLLVKVGFKQIEVGFPAASQPDFDFVRRLVDGGHIPDDVTVQVLTQSRPELIARTFEALVGVKRAIVHLYNSTSTVQREQVFGLDRDGITRIATDGARLVKETAARYPDIAWTFEYSPESFTGTELDYAVEICNAVIDVWQPTPAHKCIINLPSTVEMATPNVYADQIEWFCRHVARRDAIEISLHTHNDRGCAVAAAELAVMAGADRVEGTLLGNGERTGNMDIVTMGMNLYSQGIDPGLDFARMDEIIRCVTACTQMAVHPRHPYAGELVFTAFSGSHQDAIKKCLAQRRDEAPWEVAYLPIDPADLGRTYQEVIRINSQSGKGGVAYVLERQAGYQLPRWLQIDFSGVVQKHAEATETEVEAGRIVELFEAHYLGERNPFELAGYQVTREHDEDRLKASLRQAGVAVTLHGKASGVVGAFVAALEQHTGKRLVLVEYSEHTLCSSAGAGADAVAYVQINVDGTRYCGVGRSSDIVEASLRAILSAVNRQARIAPAIAA